MFHAICLAILLQQKLQEKLPGVTYPTTNIIIQQIVTMPIYGKQALNICHPA